MSPTPRSDTIEGSGAFNGPIAIEPLPSPITWDEYGGIEHEGIPAKLGSYALLSNIFRSVVARGVNGARISVAETPNRPDMAMQANLHHSPATSRPDSTPLSRANTAGSNMGGYRQTTPCSLTVCATTAFVMPPMTKCTVRAISNTVHINGFRCRRACSVPSLMFHRVNRTSRYPRGWFGVVGQAPLPRRGIREGDPFCGPVAMRLGVGGSRSGRASVRSRL